MGRLGQVWGHGPFDVDIVYHMPYPEDHYEGVEPGVTVSGLIGEVCANESSVALEEALGVDVDSMHWEISKEWVDLHVLDRLRNEQGNGDVVAIVDAVLELLDHDWRLFYDPNG